MRKSEAPKQKVLYDTVCMSVYQQRVPNEDTHIYIYILFSVGLDLTNNPN